MVDEYVRKLLRRILIIPSLGGDALNDKFQSYQQQGGSHSTVITALSHRSAPEQTQAKFAEA
jgi:hypothetical protein